MDRTFEKAKEIVRSAKSLVVLTGAGISQESGIPTFRGEGEHWRGKQFEELATPEAFDEDSRNVWEWYAMRREVVLKCEPNEAHLALARHEQRCRSLNRTFTLLTQNVDGLHERAGSLNVHRVHGSLWRNRCMQCGEEHWVKQDAESAVVDQIPTSPCCNATERPAIVWFGECLPSKVISIARLALIRSDALLVVGTSGCVVPAANWVFEGLAMGVPVVNVNIDPINAFPGSIHLTGRATELVAQLF